MAKERAPRRTVREHGPDPIDVKVGGRLRQARLLAGLSQEELGDGIGVSFQAVQKYEHGENRLSASRLFRAATLLCQSVAFFFDEVADDGAVPAAPHGAFSRDEIEFVRHYRQISDDAVRSHVAQTVKSLCAASQTKASVARSMT